MNKLFQYLWTRYAREGIEAPSLGKWGHLLASAILAAASAVVCYRVFNFADTYSEPVVGNIAWNFATKFHDYAVLYGFVGSFFVSLTAISALSGRLSRRFGTDAGDRFHDVLLLLCAPAGLWFAGLLTSKSTALWPLELSGALVLTAICLGFVLNLRPETFWDGGATQVARLIRLIIVLAGLSPFGVAAIGVGFNRIAAVAGARVWLSSHQIYQAAAVTAVVALTAATCLALGIRSAHQVDRLLVRLGFCLQAVFPAFFLLLIPTPWLSGDRAVLGYRLTTAAWALIVVCVVAAYVDLLRRYKRISVSPSPEPGDSVSSMCVVGLLLFFKATVVAPPSVPPDDYHFGEILVPWWSMARHHLVPFWDYTPARGLMNYVPGAITSIFLDGKASSFPAFVPFAAVAILCVALPVLRRSIGIGAATLALLISPCINLVSEIDIMVTVFLCVLARGLTRWNPIGWIATWLLLGTALLLYAPGQGGLAILATTPLALLPLARALATERRRLLAVLAGTLCVFLAVGLLSPFGKMVLGAVRYGLEQSSVNSVAHGINWNASFGKADVNAWLFEIMRGSWLLAALWSGTVIWQARSAAFATRRAATLAYAVPILLLSVLFVVRAAGRIDPGPSRLGLASIWMLSLLLPLLLFGPARSRSTGRAVLIWLSLVGLVHPYFNDFGTNYANAFDPIAVGPSVDGASAGIPELGVGAVDPAHLARLSAIRRVLDSVLDSGETYLDLSGRHANYFYVNRRPPIETGSIYNLVTEGQQRRAIAALRKERPPAILVRADNVYHDGGPVSLRANLIYRYVLLESGYKVVKIGEHVWLLRADRIGRTSGLDVRSVSDIGDEPTNLTHEVFRAENLSGIPATWGRSAATLEGKMRLVKELPQTARKALNAVKESDNGYYRPIAKDPFIRIDISDWHLSGRQAGILSFDFLCKSESREPPLIELYWASATNTESELTVVRFRGENGRLIVPMDAAPAWLLAGELRSIRFDVADSASCSEFKIENVKLFQRHGAD